MNAIPKTTEMNYITGRAALNIPNPDGSFADWHFDEVFLSGRGKIRVAGIDTIQTFGLLGSYGIRECSSVLRRFGASVPNEQEVYAANHIRAILDMVLFSLAKLKKPDHVTAYDLLENLSDIEELEGQIQALKQRITDEYARALLIEWEEKHLASSIARRYP